MKPLDGPLPELPIELARLRALQRFAENMRQRLDASQHYDRRAYDGGSALMPGWLQDDCSFEHLLNRMAEHCGQINSMLRIFINGNHKEKLLVAVDDLPELVKQCADCANFAMMIADRAQQRTRKLIPPLGGFFVE